MEKAVIVAVDLAGRKKEEAQREALAELNRLLVEGWSVKTISAMGGTETYQSASLVVLHKD